MDSHETVLVENAVSKLYLLQCISIGISTFLNEHFQLEQFHLKPSNSNIFWLMSSGSASTLTDLLHCLGNTQSITGYPGGFHRVLPHFFRELYKLFSIPFKTE